MEQPKRIKEQPDLLIKEYLSTLSEKEYKAYKIAESHLETSFDLIKSNGYLKWLKSRENDK
jgi:hypothetical protein